MTWHLIITKEGHRISVQQNKDKEELINKLNKNYSDKKYHAKVIGIPEIKLGLKLYRNGQYYKTIIGISDTLYYMTNVNTFTPGVIPDPMRIERLTQLFIKGLLDTDIEEYDNIENATFFNHSSKKNKYN
ncbi:hypothetical protein ACFHWD_04265 [Clostridium sp. MT-14]|uniref:hypothetical protein n=1 Tax=Clostridium sp. MT-14 TaxID=3348360 RepID=UPI0035F446A6